jgi:DNA-binding IclR family transcriptional regulator
MAKRSGQSPTTLEMVSSPAPRPQPKGAVERMLAILEQLAPSHPMSLADLSQAVDIPATTLATLLREMVDHGVLTLVEGRPKRYTVGPALLHLVSQALRRRDLRDVALPVMEEASQRLGVTLHLAVLSDRADSAIYVAKVAPHHPPFHVMSYVGATAPLHATALGKVLLAHVRDGLRPSILSSLRLEPRTPKTMRTVEELQAEIAQVRLSGVAFDLEENEKGVSCCAAPVYNLLGDCMAAVSLTCPTTRFQEVAPQTWAAEITQVARTISREMGYQPS